MCRNPRPHNRCMETPVRIRRMANPTKVERYARNMTPPTKDRNEEFGRAMVEDIRFPHKPKSAAGSSRRCQRMG